MARLRADAPGPSAAGPQSSPGSESQPGSVEAPAQPACDIFNTTFSLHRASPLFVGAEGLPETRLRALGQRLRDTLVGDVVRGVEVGLDGGGDSAMGNAGVLEAVTIEWVGAQGAIATSKPALQVTLQFENALCSAVLLPLPQAEELAATTAAKSSPSFLHLPLLLLRMPAPLKTVIVDFLSSTFDCRIASIRLSSKDIIQSWESWARMTALPARGPLAKDAVLTLAFRLPGSGKALDTIENAAADDSAPTSTAVPDTAALGLKAIDVFVPNDDLCGFLKAGRKLSSDSSDETDGTPFIDALTYYLKHHLALDMTNPAVGVVRIACGGFVLSESRLKIFGTSESSLDIYSSRHRAAVPQLLGDLVVRASGLG